MTIGGWLQIIVFLCLLTLLVKPLGSYMARVLSGEPVWVGRFIRPVERLVYRIGGVDPEVEMSWQAFSLAFLVFSLVGMVFLYLLQRVQGWLPLNPQGVGAVEPALALNTAVSFVTNTNWQNYAGETTLSYLTQMLGLTVQNFLSA
ncbi:potassium-transporting ATPase subunit KdpA, partial [bacterium]|nr:potassium-transporting ATPase subunit KdpA [bacterium]